MPEPDTDRDGEKDTSLGLVYEIRNKKP
eukprot:SAG31_NODE_40443_length_280_cov_3.906077_2_plen_27_part_01